jgi:MFS family permease
MTIWHIVAQTWTKDLFPSENVGQFSGYYLIFNVLIGMSIGPLIGGWISELYGNPIRINGIPGYVPTPWLFIVGAIIMIFSIVPVSLAKGTKLKKNEQKEV